MPKGVVLVRFPPGDWKRARNELCRMRGDPDFASATKGALLESWMASMGSADFVAFVHASSLEALRAASAELRSRLNKTCEGASTLTTTIVGSTLREQSKPQELIESLIGRRQDARRQDADVGEAEQNFLLDLYLTNLLESVLLTLRKWRGSGRMVRQYQEELATAAQAYLANTDKGRFTPVEDLHSEAETEVDQELETQQGRS